MTATPFKPTLPSGVSIMLTPGKYFLELIHCLRQNGITEAQIEGLIDEVIESLSVNDREAFVDEVAQLPLRGFNSSPQMERLRTAYLYQVSLSDFAQELYEQARAIRLFSDTDAPRSRDFFVLRKRLHPRYLIITRFPF